MKIRRKRCSAADGMLTPTVKFDIFLTISHDPPWSLQHLSKRCAQQRKYTIIVNKQLQKNGTWQL